MRDRGDRYGPIEWAQLCKFMSSIRLVCTAYAFRIEQCVLSVFFLFFLMVVQLIEHHINDRLRTKLD